MGHWGIRKEKRSCYKQDSGRARKQGSFAKPDTENMKRDRPGKGGNRKAARNEPRIAGFGRRKLSLLHDGT